MQMLPKFVFENTIAYIHVATHVALKYNQSKPINTNHRVCLEFYTFIYKAIFVIVQVQLH